MAILGIDPGTRCGWALRRQDGTMDSGVWDLRGSRFEGGGMRYLRFRQFLVDLFAVVTPEKVVFEEIRMHMGVDAAHVYGGLVAILTAECEKRALPYEGIHYSSVKSFATGNGNAKKPVMLAAAQARWPGWQFEDDNEADARFIAEVGFHGAPARVSKKKARKVKEDTHGRLPGL